jgi:hypothetical protein
MRRYNASRLPDRTNDLQTNLDGQMHNDDTQQERKEGGSGTPCVMPRVIELGQTCQACPSQWKGMTDDDRRVYVRYRWGCLSVRLGAVADHGEFAAVNGEEIYCEQIGEDFDGAISETEMKDATEHAVEWADSAAQRTKLSGPGRRST